MAEAGREEKSERDGARARERERERENCRDTRTGAFAPREISPVHTFCDRRESSVANQSV